MPNDKGDLASALVIGVGKPKKMAKMGDSMEDEEGGGDLEMVAEDLIDAVGAKDVAKVAIALRAAHGICNAGYEDDNEA